MWGADGAAGGAAHTLRHAAYYERTLLNAVLGTQRGTLPGAMLYMCTLPASTSITSTTSTTTSTTLQHQQQQQLVVLSSGTQWVAASRRRAT